MNALIRLLLVVAVGVAAVSLVKIGQPLVVPGLDNPPPVTDAGTGRLTAPAAHFSIAGGPASQQPPDFDCRAIADGYLESSPVFGHDRAAFIHASYFTDGPPVLNVLLEGGRFQRPIGMGGRWWAYPDCREYAEAQVAGHLERSGEGRGDASLFTPAS